MKQNEEMKRLYNRAKSILVALHRDEHRAIYEALLAQHNIPSPRSAGNKLTAQEIESIKVLIQD